MEVINVSSIADDVIFALGDYIKYRDFDKEKIDDGIKICEDILEGAKIEDGKVTFENLSDYEKYKLIKDNEYMLKERGINIEDLQYKTKEVINNLQHIRNQANQKERVADDKIKDIQNYFVTIGTPFWEDRKRIFKQRKLSRGLQLNV